MTFERFAGLEKGSIAADLMDTEDEEKVMSALKKIFPESSAKKEERKLVGSVELSFFKELAEKEKIRAAVEAVLDKNLSGDHSYIDLNKIAALAGRIGLDEESPIGKIRLRVAWKKA